MSDYTDTLVESVKNIPTMIGDIPNEYHADQFRNDPSHAANMSPEEFQSTHDYLSKMGYIGTAENLRTSYNYYQDLNNEKNARAEAEENSKFKLSPEQQQNIVNLMQEATNKKGQP